MLAGKALFQINAVAANHTEIQRRQQIEVISPFQRQSALPYSKIDAVRLKIGEIFAGDYLDLNIRMSLGEANMISQVW